MNEVLQDYGLIGVVIGGLAYYVIRIEDRHRKERDEMRNALEDLNKETNKIIRENISILSGLKTLLENKR